jgi:hypothetical protein
VVGSVLIVSSMTREKKADISRACLGMCFGMSSDSLWEWVTLEIYILNIAD